MSATVELTDVSPPLTSSRGKTSRSWHALLLAAVLFSSLSIWAAVASPGFLEADACTHYQYARFALGETHYLVNVWGRPFVTAIYAIPATLGGRLGVRLTSLACALVIAIAAYRIAKFLGYRWSGVAFSFVLASPLLFLHSFSELTELPFAMLLALAFWCYCKREWLALAIVTSLLPTARPEGFGFLVLAALALIAHRRWWWLLILPLPLLIWNYAGWVIYGRPAYTDAMSMRLPESLRWLMWLKYQWPYAQKSTYRPGALYHFVALLPAVVGPLVLPFVILGIARSGSSLSRFAGQLSRRRVSESEHLDSPAQHPDQTPNDKNGDGSSFKTRSAPVSLDHKTICEVLIAAIPLMILVGHSLLYWLGRMASNGELRYLLVVAPFWGLLAARGFELINWRWPHVVAGVIALAPISVNFYQPILPIRLTHDAYRARAMGEWYRDSGVNIAYPRLMSSNPEVAYYMDISHTDDGWIRPWDKGTCAKAPPGTLMIWEPTYALNNSDANRVVTLEEVRAAGWVERPDLMPETMFFDPGMEWRIFLAPTSIVGEASASFRTQ